MAESRAPGGHVLSAALRLATDALGRDLIPMAEDLADAADERARTAEAENARLRAELETARRR